MAEFKLNINLSCDEDKMSGSWNETHGDTVNADNIKSEITSWLEDLGFTVEDENDNGIPDIMENN